MESPRTTINRVFDALLPPHALVSRRALKLVALLTIVIVISVGTFVSIVDGEEIPTVWDGIWWAASTVTTVGYGDIVPTQPAARIAGIFLMFTGIGLVSILTASIASALLAEDVEEEELHIEERLDRLEQMLTRIESQLTQSHDASSDSEPPKR
jgi:voltage-gated potassium channel